MILKKMSGYTNNFYRIEPSYRKREISKFGFFPDGNGFVSAFNNLGEALKMARKMISSSNNPKLSLDLWKIDAEAADLSIKPGKAEGTSKLQSKHFDRKITARYISLVRTLTKNNEQVGTQLKTKANMYYFVYDMDTKEMAVCPSNVYLNNGLASILNYPDRWIGGVYYPNPGGEPRIATQWFEGVSNKDELNSAAIDAVKKLEASQRLSKTLGIFIPLPSPKDLPIPLFDKEAAKDEVFKVGEFVRVNYAGRKYDGKILGYYADKNLYQIELYAPGNVTFKLKAQPSAIEPVGFSPIRTEPEYKKTIVAPNNPNNDYYYLIYWSKDREELQDIGITLNEDLALSSSKEKAFQLFKTMKGVDLWEIDMWGMHIYPGLLPNSGIYWSDEKIFPEQMELVATQPAYEPKEKKKKWERGYSAADAPEYIAWMYDMDTGELLVAPGKQGINVEWWKSLGKSLRWMSGQFHPGEDPPILVQQRAKNLDPNKQEEYEADILKKLQDIPIIKNAMAKHGGRWPEQIAASQYKKQYGLWPEHDSQAIWDEDRQIYYRKEKRIPTEKPEKVRFAYDIPNKEIVIAPYNANIGDQEMWGLIHTPEYWLLGDYDFKTEMLTLQEMNTEDENDENAMMNIYIDVFKKLKEYSKV